MRSKIGIIAIILLMAMAIGTASAAVNPTPVIGIMPDSGPNVAPDGTVLVPIGTDAATSIGLGVQYSNFTAGNPYSQFVTDPSLVVVPGTVSAGPLPTGNDFVPIHWTPTSGDIGKTFTITAEAWTSIGTRITVIQETAPAQPIPVSAAVLGGFIATAGLISRRYIK